MFIDEAKVYVKAGDGGDGIVAFRREKYVPEGGPAGGDGGNGGDVIFEVNEGLSTLMDFRYNRHFKGKRGENGMSKGKHGKNAEDLIVEVPPGTTVYNDATNEVIADLTENKQKAVIVKGGKAGKGNMRFASAKNPAPNIAENGEIGEELNIRVELKVIADVGLVGFPSVGKSTLLSVVSAATPKIADYPFTTLAPNLGFVTVGDGRSFVMADLPGLIEGAHEGVGLGFQFLRHVERTRIIVHMIDLASLEDRDPFDDYQRINKELESYGSNLIEKPQVIVANKMDMPGSEEKLEKLKEQLPTNTEIVEISTYTQTNVDKLIYKIAYKQKNIQNKTKKIKKLKKQLPTNNEIVEISTYTQNNVDKLIYKIADKLENIPHEPHEEEEITIRYEEKEAPFKITRSDDGAYVLSGPKIERIFHATDFTYDESVQRFARQVRHLGVDDELRKRGAKDGDTNRILDFEFEFNE